VIAHTIGDRFNDGGSFAAARPRKASSITSRTAMMSLPSTWMPGTPPAIPFCASVSQAVCFSRGSEMAQKLLITRKTTGSFQTPRD
jgi:hypothetical protein